MKIDHSGSWREMSWAEISPTSRLPRCIAAISVPWANSVALRWISTSNCMGADFSSQTLKMSSIWAFHSSGTEGVEMRITFCSCACAGRREQRQRQRQRAERQDEASQGHGGVSLVG